MVTDVTGEALLTMITGDNETPFKAKVKGEYTPKIWNYAMTLHFYSLKAYNYVRKMFNNNLPNPSTVRAWYRAVNGSPGLTVEALEAIKLRTQKKIVVTNLVIDEMSIREQLIYQQGRFHGCVDFGDDHDYQNDNAVHATNALVFMAVALNDSWKVPIGYFSIRLLDSKERANLIKLALKELHEID
ncbi:uncharacterized protein [Chelonus insularis]|uniref:uncharacterized protein n=1 Tax=Chelonus insularis TaxID=460826 RepID=UPI00158AE9DB|nr:uncharacterized protein LOC118070744 [Chelonus insularis]